MNNTGVIIIKTLLLACAIFNSFICFGGLTRPSQKICGLNILLMSLSIAGFIACQFWCGV